MTRLLVTRPDGQQTALVECLFDAGIDVAWVATISIDSAADGDVAHLAAKVAGVDWIVITSANGVPGLVRALGGEPLPRGTRLAAVGPATASALERAGLKVDAMPARYLTAAIADALGDVGNRRVLLARADVATADLRQALVERGAQVEEVTAYRTVEGPWESRDVVRRVLDEGVDGILFTSGSTVRGLMELVPPHLRQRVTCLPAFCIGPVTAEAARRAGFAVAAVADEHTAHGLARTTIDYFSQEAS